MTETFWFHELSAQGKGPDWVFNATFAPDSSAALAATVRGQVPVGFTYYRATQRPCPLHAKVCDYDLYVDTPHYDACIAQLEGRAQPNIYVYHCLQICQHTFQLVRGYGGYTEQHGSAETQVIRAIAQAPNLAMADWSIVYGGVTYSYATLTSGTTPAALLAYLDSR